MRLVKVYTLSLTIGIEEKPFLSETNWFCSNECAAEWYDEAFVEIRKQTLLKEMEKQ